MAAEYFPRFIEALGKSDAGKSLKNTLRWETQFRTTETDEEWRQIFGATGQVYTHSIIFYNLSKLVLAKEASRFSPHQRRTFRYGVGPHDVGEAKIDGEGVGDVMAIIKTDEDEKNESVMAKVVIATLDLPPATKRRLNHGYGRVINGKNAELHSLFKATEKSEYVLTAMKVYQNSMKLEARGQKGLTHLKPLVGRVLVVDLAKVLDVYAPQYPDSIGAIFRGGQKLIDEMFEYSLPWLMFNTNWMGKDIDHPALAEAFKAKWDNFKNQPTP